MIGGSNVSRGAISPHFQFSTNATNTENMRMNDKIVEFMLKVVGKIGFGEKRELGPKFRINAKGGMYDTKFENFF